MYIYYGFKRQNLEPNDGIGPSFVPLGGGNTILSKRALNFEIKFGSIR